jgi:hypothetical protein
MYMIIMLYGILIISLLMVHHSRWMIQYMRRFDAVEDRKGVIFVYDADAARVVEICSSREEADAKATEMAKGLSL